MEVLSWLIFFYTFTTLSLFLDITYAVDFINGTLSISDTGQTLVSSGGSFELGFFSPGNSRNRYLGIWYKDIIPSTVVWVANRNNPIFDSSGVLKIGNDGNIVLLDRLENAVVWSTNFSGKVVNPIAQLLESGNFVLRDWKSNDLESSYMWQSFDYPCDTLLPGMKLGYNLTENRTWSLTSWKSRDDPSPGDFIYSLDPGLHLGVLRKGSQILFRSKNYGAGREDYVDGSSSLSKDEAYYKFEDFEPNVTRLSLNQSGSLEHLIWNKKLNGWTVLAKNYEQDKCDRYGFCGTYGTCNISDSPICKCPEGFEAKPGVVSDTSGPYPGCVRRVQFDCSKQDRFVWLTRVKLPDKPIFLNSTTQCETECLRRCSCTAYTETDFSSCIIWTGDLIDIKKYNDDYEWNLFVRVATEHDSNDKEMKIIIIISVVFAITLLSSMSGYITWKKMSENRPGIHINDQSSYYGDEGQENEQLELPIFDFVTILAATDNFSLGNKIGKGGFGPVYKGQLSTGQEIAVKRLAKESGQGMLEFKNEVMLIAKLQHRNLVRLLGCCIQGDERMLIYEYMPNKSLDTFIFDETKSSSVNWLKRFDIILGIARGILYLHQDSRLRIIHRDLKASNILLDGDMNPKISDFGAAKSFGGDQTEATTNRVVGTYGYMSPEYAIDGLFSIKSDVFSFGVLVLEIVSGRRNRGFQHPDHDLNLLGHAWKLWNEGKAIELMDAEMKTPCSVTMTTEVIRCIQVGLLCVQQRPGDRPTMSTVVFMLGRDAATLPQPTQPGFSTARFGFSTEMFLIDKPLLPTDKTSSSSNELTATTLEGR